MWDWDHLIRVMFAGLCGALIGYERKSRMKEAGIRTHFIVGIGAALMMVVSKYGFQDQTAWPNLSLDPSRVAAQVIISPCSIAVFISWLPRLRGRS
ncbi:putative Mg2+ transporter-C (MgtC) family protein [Paenibacillus brasilensis]|uniref:Mg2+ transporter-C (MgtC) family protein n=1 Tax=Paenibacillus brasilensis TaxID=128574 RepID=A0ABU0L5Z6_9BACL|nr:putative Mg2+ transporter-C (MgtC) family protein [Paenibacillus brasilensis]